jgi:hypothetical protein
MREELEMLAKEARKSTNVADRHVTALPCHPFLQRIAGLAGWVLAATALAAFAHDLILFGQTGTYRAIPAGQVWFDIHAASLNLIQAMVQRFLHPLLWDPVIATILQWPAWSLLGAPAAVLIAIVPSRSA